MPRLYVFTAILLVHGVLMSNVNAQEEISDWLSLAAEMFSGSTPAADGQGLDFRFDMGTRRRNWPHAQWSVHQFAEAADLSSAIGLAVRVSTAEPRQDVGVYVALREADGTWYSHPWAVHLAVEDNHGVARFADFSSPDHHSPPHGRHQDPNGRFDTDAITAIAIGVVNPLGVGEVAFTLRSVGLVSAPAEEEEPAALRVTGRWLDINRTITVPSGLFGGFHLGDGRHERYRLAASRTIHHDGLSGSARLGHDLTPIHINSIGDRVRPSPRLTHGEWEERSEQQGAAFGQAAVEAERPLYVEYWNEPYLNWANYNRANFIPRYYDIDQAEEGGSVHFRHDGSVAQHLIWTQDRRWYLPEIFAIYGRRFGADRDHWRRGRTEDGRVLSTSAMPYNQGMQHFYGGRWEPESHPPKDVADGETYTYRNQTLTAFTPWHVVDTTQFAYWSGKGMLTHYIDPMLAFGRGLKQANPDATYIVGWGNRPSEDHWAGFHQLYQPTIDAGIDLIDAYNDHDYGGDPTNLAASYEVVTGYGVTRHDKWLYAYNTEAASSSDPQVYREEAAASADVAKFEWVTRKMMHTLQFVPDKARVFLHFGAGQNTSQGGGWWSDDGEGVAMEMLINLRGRLLEVVHDQPDLYAVAAIDGTDDYAPRPDFLPDRQEVVLALFNDRQQARPVAIDLQLPAGVAVGPGVMRHSTVVDGAVQVIDEDLVVDGERLRHSLTMGPRELRVITLPLTHEVDPAALASGERVLRRRQFFGHTMLQEVLPEAPVNEELAIDAADLNQAHRAELRIVAQRLGHGDGEAVINGHVYSLPAAVTPENAAWVRTVAIDPAHLQPVNDIVIRATNPRRAGFFLGNFSLWVDAVVE